MSRDQLYSENQKLIKEVSQLSRKLEKSENYKTHFLSNMRNSICNPFASIIGLAQHIIKVQKDDWKKVIRIAALIHSEAFDLDFQLKNIFSAAEVEAGVKQPMPQMVNISDFLNEELTAHRYLFRKKDLAWRIQMKGEQDKFCTDLTFLSVILSNLLHNAFKYSKQEGEIHITSSIKDDELQLTIKDFGVGIESDKLEAIFDRFERIDDEINSIDSGQGLGLAVVKMLIELLHGTITVDSKHGKFSEFKIKIPEMSGCVEDEFEIDEADFFIEEGATF